MATTATKAEVPTFSYAQAAKGLAASTTSQQNAKATDQSGKTTQDNEVTKASAPEQTPNSVSAESSRLSEKAESVADHESKSATTASTKNPVSGASTPSFGTASTSTLAKEDEIPTLTNGDSHWENKSQTSASADKSNNSKDKDGKKDDFAKSADKNPPVKELKAAPLPTINVWQQRKEAQEAKAKASAAILKAANAANKATPSKGASPATANAPDSIKAANKKKTANDSQADASGSLNKDRKRVENGKPREEGPKKSTNRLPRSNEESADVAPPPVADATAWPTPQTALGEEKRKAQEKSDKSEKVEKSPSTRGKEKWTPVHYVPTAVFNTPLPSGARRGGRPSRGGREGGRGGAHSSNSNTDSSAAPVDTKPAAAAQPSQAQPKQHANLPERGRNEGGLARANSLPAQARKPVTTDANAQQPDQRRFQPNSERPRVDTRPKATEENHAASNGSAPVDSAAKTSREARSAKAPEFIPAHKASDRSPRSGTSPVDGQGNGRFVPNHERRFDNGTKSVETPRDINGFVPREREFKDYNREKGEYQRDHQKERGESRPERGRGTYRGRGSHPYNGPHNQHFQNSQVSQHPFVPKSFNAGDRQRSQHQNFQNGTQPQHVNHRLSLRSPSVPNSAGLYSAYPVPDINTMYQGYQHVAPGPMSAVPYQPYMEPFNLFTLIQMQLEYYFSVDNLCKDLYLRKHMDSQGFVRLSFIAGFKRIRNLTEDFEMLRHCARQLRNAEYMISEDGQDRLRPREKWEQWVLPIDQRDSSAQNDGHTAATFHSAEDNNSPVHMTNGINSNGSQAATNGVPNGVHEQVDPQTTLSSAAPEFTPYVAVGGHNESSNGTAQ